MRFARFGALLLTLAFLRSPAAAVLRVDGSDPVFKANAEKELEAMRSGQRGVVSRQLVERLEKASATTTIRPLTADESTWHPNDLKGTRSHVVPRDTRVRGAVRDRPTDADVFIHPPRVDSSMSLFRLGTFVHELSVAADLNEGLFTADYRVREKRASFYRNAWLDALGYKPLSVSDRIPTPEYHQAKAKGLLTEENAAAFPFVGPSPSPAPSAAPSPAPSPIPADAG